MTNAEARFNNSLRPRKPEGSLGRTAQDGHLDSHTPPKLSKMKGEVVITEIGFSLSSVDLLVGISLASPPMGDRPGMLVSPLSGISGLSFDSPFLSLLFSPLSSCFFCLVIFLLMVHSPDFFQKTLRQIFNALVSSPRRPRPTSHQSHN